METIWKYNIDLDDFSLSMPKGARIIKVENGFMWAIVTPDNESEERHFSVHGTGHPITNHDRKKYIGTWFMGIFVWHLFELFK